MGMLGPVFLAGLLAVAQPMNDGVKFTKNPPALSGGLGSDELAATTEQPSSNGGAAAGEAAHLHITDYFLNAPCGTDRVLADVEVWLHTWPPFRETYKYARQMCVDAPRLSPTTPAAAPTDIDTALARAFIRERLPIPTVALDPGGFGLTGLATHAWYEDDGRLRLTFADHDGDAATPPVLATTVTAADGPYRLSATVWIDRYSWDMGDGTTLSARVPGAPTEPAATHVYRTKSPDYVVTARVVWRGHYDWSSPVGSGSGVDMGELVVTSTPVRYPVREVRAVPAED